MGSTKSSEYRAFLFEIIARHSSSSARSWWESTLSTMASLSARGGFGQVYARAARTLGAAPIDLNDDEITTLSRDEVPLIWGRPLHELGRMVLLLQVIEIRAPEVCAKFIDDLYVRGDVAERQALLRALPLLPDPDSFLSTAVEACRSNVHTVFEAIACENPYPVRHFPESNFNQMVMKLIFIGIPLQRIVGLPARITPVLVRMANDYVQEQIASGRPVHDDMHLLTNKG